MMINVVDLTTLTDHSVSLEASSTSNQVVAAILRRILSSSPSSSVAGSSDAARRRNSNSSSGSSDTASFINTYGLYAIRKRDDVEPPAYIAHRMRGDDRPLHVLRQLRKVNAEAPQFVLGSSSVASRFIMARLEDEVLMPFRLESSSLHGNSPFFHLISRLGPRDLCGYFGVRVNSGLTLGDAKLTMSRHNSSSSSSAMTIGDDDSGSSRRRWVTLVADELAVYKNHEMEESGRVVPLAHASVSIPNNTSNNNAPEFEMQTPTMSYVFTRVPSSSPASQQQQHQAAIAEVGRWVEALRERSVWCTENEMISVAERMLNDICEVRERADFTSVRSMLESSSSSSFPLMNAGEEEGIGFSGLRRIGSSSNEREGAGEDEGEGETAPLPDVFKDVDYALNGFWTKGGGKLANSAMTAKRSRFESLLIEFSRRFTKCEYLLLWYMDADVFLGRIEGGASDSGSSSIVSNPVRGGGGGEFQEEAFEARALNERGKTLLLSTPPAREWLETNLTADSFSSALNESSSSSSSSSSSPIPPTSPKFKSVVNFDLKRTKIVVRSILNQELRRALVGNPAWIERIVSGCTAGGE